jgi:hypothetical protein
MWRCPTARMRRRRRAHWPRWKRQRSVSGDRPAPRAPSLRREQARRNDQQERDPVHPAVPGGGIPATWHRHIDPERGHHQSPQPGRAADPRNHSPACAAVVILYPFRWRHDDPRTARQEQAVQQNRNLTDYETPHARRAVAHGPRGSNPGLLIRGWKRVRP